LILSFLLDLGLAAPSQLQALRFGDVVYADSRDAGFPATTAETTRHPVP
jgi:hypothetical protein